MDQSNELNGKQMEGPQKANSWNRFLFKLLAGYVLYALAAHLVNPAKNSLEMTSEQKIVFELLAYLLDFLFIFAVISVIVVFIARLPPQNRSKPLLSYFNKSLIFVFLVSCISLYGGWNYNRLVADSKQIGESTKDTSEIIAAITMQNAEGLTAG